MCQAGYSVTTSVSQERPLDPIPWYRVYLVLSLKESSGMALTIGQVANAADVNIQTIRYYERRGLFPTPRRTPAGYRQYADDAVARLRFIKHAQELGFSLQEIQELLGLRVRRGAGLAATFEPLRPYFVAGTVLALGFGFVVLRGEEKRACVPGTLCVSPIARRRMKWALWTATIVSIPLLTFPWWSKLVLG